MFTSDIPRALRDLAEALKLYKYWTFFGLQTVLSRYRRSLLGPLWISLGLLSTGFALSFVFGGLFGQPLQQVLPFVLGGVTVYYFFAAPLAESGELFIASSGMIKTKPFPYMVYVFQSMTSIVIIFAHNLVAFYLLVYLIGARPIPHWTLLPALGLLLVYMSFAGCVTAMLTARFRDLRFMLPYVAQMFFFITPIFWDPRGLQGGPREMVLDYNPFYYMLNLTRGPLLGEAPRLIDWGVTAGVTVVSFLAWLFVFGAFRRRLVFWL